MSFLATERYIYSADEAAEILVHSVKANRDCKSIRKAFNLCRSTLLGKIVDPNYCLDRATKLVDCFQDVRRGDVAPERKAKFDTVAACVKTHNGAGAFSFPKSCQDELNQYLSA